MVACAISGDAMKALSPQTRSKTNEVLDLVARKSFFGNRSKITKALKVLEQIRLAQEPSAIPYLRDLLFATDARIKDKTAETIHALAKDLKPRDYLWLDEWIRSAWLSSGFTWNNQIKSGALSDMAGTNSFE